MYQVVAFNKKLRYLFLQTVCFFKLMDRAVNFEINIQREQFDLKGNKFSNLRAGNFQIDQYLKKNEYFLPDAGR